MADGLYSLSGPKPFGEPLMSEDSPQTMAAMVRRLIELAAVYHQKDGDASNELDPNAIRNAQIQEDIAKITNATFLGEETRAKLLQMVQAHHTQSQQKISNTMQIRGRWLDLLNSMKQAFEQFNGSRAGTVSINAMLRINNVLLPRINEALNGVPSSRTRVHMLEDAKYRAMVFGTREMDQVTLLGLLILSAGEVEQLPPNIVDSLFSLIQKSALENFSISAKNDGLNWQVQYMHPVEQISKISQSIGNWNSNSYGRYA